MSRHWVFTVYGDEVKFFFDECVEYCIFGNEKCPTTGRWHKQGYVCFVNRKRMSAVKKLDSTAHWEVKRGTVRQAVDYCKKDGDYYERGDLPVEERHHKDSEFKVVLDLVRAGDFKAIENGPYLGTYIRYKKTFDSYDDRKFEPLDEPRGVWLHGTPGVGKDTAVINKYKPYVKPHNKWWDGYNDEETVLFSDMGADEFKYFVNHLKQWADRYPFTAEYKGGSRKIHPKKFFVTSNFSLSSCCRAVDTDVTPFKRRFDCVDADTKTVTKRMKCKPDVTLEELI